MSDNITVRGFVATEPRSSTTPGGVATASFRLGSTERRYDRATSAWVDGNTNWFTVQGYRQLAGNIGCSVKKGQRVIVVGTAQDAELGERRPDLPRRPKSTPSPSATTSCGVPPTSSARPASGPQAAAGPAGPGGAPAGRQTVRETRTTTRTTRGRDDDGARPPTASSSMTSAAKRRSSTRKRAN